MKYYFFLPLLLIGFMMSAQTTVEALQNYPVFEECKSVETSNMEGCFNRTLQQYIYDHYKLPENRVSFEGQVQVLFEVTKEGNFQVLYVDAPFEDLKDEVYSVFNSLPKIEPATFSGKATYNQFSLSIKLPLIAPGETRLNSGLDRNPRDLLVNEYDAIENLPFSNEEYTSNINIPFSHKTYSTFDPAMNKVGHNSHTASKPFIYSEVNKYYDFEGENAKLMKRKTSWFGRKFWNEHMITIKGKDYWITLDPGVDLQLGRDYDRKIDTYNNTRLVYTQGGIGKNLHFFGAILESQGRFAGYVNDYIESIPPAGGNPGIVPGQGVAKRHNSDAYDYPVGIGYFSYSPSDAFNVQFGHGKLFLGDGYRSLLSSDNASPHPYLRLNTTFWKLKYTNTWMSLRDVRPDVAAQGSFRTKYMANHYLSYNITKRLNLGFFESVIWENDNGRGFDINYLNPVIFYRAIEFATGPRGGNAMIGLAAKYKFSDQINIYGQFGIDEFSSTDVFAGNKNWKNKTGYQIGLKYYDAFGLPGLMLQTEYNKVRPYSYSHNTITLNYGHLNQTMAHTLGANFSEFIGIARYQSGRVFGDLKIISAIRGFDFNTEEDSFNYGGDIYRSEYEPRPREDGNYVGQGNKTQFFHGELQLGYLINPATNLKVYGSLIYRNFDPRVETEETIKNSTTWLNFGIRTDIFNWYYDF